MIVPRPDSTPKTKSELLREMFSSPTIYENTGPALPLYLFLLLVLDGLFTGTYADLSKEIQVPDLTLRKWVARLKKESLVETRLTSSGIRISLLGPSLTAARLRDPVPMKVDVERKDMPNDDPISRWVLDGLALSRKGSGMKITVEMTP